jgi:hypothetical protein
LTIMWHVSKCMVQHVEIIWTILMHSGEDHVTQIEEYGTTPGNYLFVLRNTQLMTMWHMLRYIFRHMVVISTEVKYLFYDYVTHGEVHKPARGKYLYYCETPSWWHVLHVYGSAHGNY